LKEYNRDKKGILGGLRDIEGLKRNLRFINLEFSFLLKIPCALYIFFNAKHRVLLKSSKFWSDLPHKLRCIGTLTS